MWEPVFNPVFHWLIAQDLVSSVATFYHDQRQKSNILPFLLVISNRFNDGWAYAPTVQ